MDTTSNVSNIDKGARFDEYQATMLQERVAKGLAYVREHAADLGIDLATIGEEADDLDLLAWSTCVVHHAFQPVFAPVVNAWISVTWDQAKPWAVEHGLDFTRSYGPEQLIAEWRRQLAELATSTTTVEVPAAE